MDRCTFGRKDRERLFQALEVKEAIKKEQKGNIYLGRHRYSLWLEHRAQWQHMETKEVENYPRGFVSRASLNLEVRNHDECYIEEEVIVLCFRKIMLVKSPGDGLQWAKTGARTISGQLSNPGRNGAGLKVRLERREQGWKMQWD